MSNDEIYQMPLSLAIKIIPADVLVALVSNPVFAAALRKACENRN